MKHWEKWLGIGVIVAVILTIVVSVYAEGMSVSQAAENVAEAACAEHGGVSGSVEWIFGYGDYYRADFECREGGESSEWFECVMCFPVEP